MQLHSYISNERDINKQGGRRQKEDGNDMGRG